MSSKRQLGRPRVFHLQNHGHIATNGMIFQLCTVNDILIHV